MVDICYLQQSKYMSEIVKNSEYSSLLTRICAHIAFELLKNVSY